MRIALVTETYPPEVNGVAMTLSRLVRGLRLRGHDVEVLRPRQRQELAEAKAGGVLASEDFLVPGVPIPRYPSLRMGLPVVVRIEERWRTWKPDLVHVATEGPLGLAVLFVAGRLGLPVTSSFHTNFHSYGGHYGLHWFQDAALAYLRWFHNRTRLTLVPTAQGARELTDSGFRNMGVMSRGVDTALFSPERRSAELRASWGAGPDDPVAVYVGRVAAEKNLGLAVKAFLRLRELEPRARFLLVGDGPERAGLEKEYPEFHYAGMRRGEDLAAHYASGDVFLFPSVTETFGNVVTEAMASGLVTVTYDYAAGREYVRSGENGFLADYDDAAAYLRAVETLAAERGRWAEIRAAARATTLGVTWDAVVARFEADVERARRV